MPDQPAQTASHEIGADGGPFADSVPPASHETTVGFEGDGGNRAATAPSGYELCEEVGSGGMGIVYRAREIAFDRDVAIKILQAPVAADSPGARRFLDEARITGQLQHPAIPPVHHIGALPDGRPFLAMKLIDGQTLDALLEAEPDNRERFVPVFAQVCQGVAFAHSRGVIHRDLKPANVMVGTFGEAQVMDWGLAKRLGSRDGEATGSDSPGGLDDAGRTQAGSVLGTPAYMAPEQAAGDIDRLDTRADVFGLGAMLCAILTGQPPYTGRTALSVCSQAARGETGDAFARLDSCGADPELTALCKRCLAADRDERPRDAGEVAAAVTAYLAAAEARARRAELDRVRSEEQRKRRRVRMALVAAVAGLVAVGGLGVLLANLWRSAERERETADFHRRQSEEEKRVADGLREEAEAQRLNARRYLYLSRVGLAARAWKDAQVQRASDLLTQELPQPGREDLRGFEWRYLWRAHLSHRHVLRGHTDVVRAVAWRPDGKRLASGGRDGMVRVWDAGPPGPPLLTTTTGGEIYALCWSPDGKMFATSATDNLVKVWDAETGKLDRTLKGHTGFVVCLDWSRDGSRIVSGSWDSTVRIWDTRSWESVVCLAPGVVEGVAFSPDGSRVAGGCADSAMRVWDARTGKALVTGRSGPAHGVQGVCWSHDGNRIAGGSGPTIWVWDARNGKELLTLRGHTGDAGRVAFDRTGAGLVSVSVDGTVRWWDTTTGKERTVLRGHTGRVLGLDISPDGRRIATGSFDTTVRVWDADADQDSVTLGGHHGWVFGVAVRPHGADVASVAMDGFARVADPHTGRLRFAPLAHGAAVHCVSYSPDGRRLVTGAADARVRAWDAATGLLERTLNTDGQPVFHAVFSPDGRYLAAASGTFWYFPPANRLIPPVIKVWRTSDWREEASLSGHAGLVTGMAFSPDSTRLATASYDHTLRLWDVAAGREVRLLRWSESWPSGVAFRPDGMELAAGSQDGALTVWDPLTGRQFKRFRAHTEDIFAVAYTPDGSRLASASHDATVKLWELDQGTEALALTAHSKPVLAVAFSPDGRRLISGSQDGSVRVWDATPLPDTSDR